MTDTIAEMTVVDLVDHIEARFHARHRDQMPALLALAEKVEGVHAGAPEVPTGLADLLHRMLGELDPHMRKEELILFPAMRRGGTLGIEQPIAVMRGEHEDHAAAIEQILRLTRDLTLPEGACRSWTALYAGLTELIDDLTEHMRIENEVLFPRFARR
ncbi:MAG: hemerythrin domain-containing protein [Proteobacteria bacterium]|nr:hemerythrin domain-containing protein [Pseudomonadota bacterium]